VSDFIPLEIDGTSDQVYIEVLPTERQSGIKQRSSKESAVDKLTEADFKQMIRKAVMPACQTFVEIWQELNQPMTAESAEVEFNLGFTASGSAFIAQASGQASFKIKVSWKFEHHSVANNLQEKITESIKEKIKLLEAQSKEIVEIYEQDEELRQSNDDKNKYEEFKQIQNKSAQVIKLLES
jgi:CRISPR-associated protein Cas8b1/Cst1 subtype I-B